MEDEWEEDEQLVVAELSGIINADFLTSCQGTCKIVGIDTDQPIMQVGRYVFAGEYDDALGTFVVFEETPGENAGPDECPALEYKCHTVKRLMMQRTFLDEWKEGEPNSGGIEMLSLNEGEDSARVCNFAPSSKKTSEDSDESDFADTHQTSLGSTTEDMEETGLDA